MAVKLWFMVMSALDGGALTPLVDKYSLGLRQAKKANEIAAKDIRLSLLKGALAIMANK